MQGRNSAAPGAKAPKPRGFLGQRPRTLDPLQPPAERRAPYSPREIYLLFKGGEIEADRAEAMLAGAVRCQTAIELDEAEGLIALQRGERLPELGHHLDDYAREFLGWEERKTRAMIAFVRQLRERPLLREAVRSGRVSLRAGQTVAPVAKGADEAAWVERAERETVRTLETAVREARGGKPVEVPGEPVPALRLVALLRGEEREAIEDGLTLAARVLPGSTRAEQLEAISQEWLGSFPGDPAEDETRKPAACFTPCRPLGRSPPSDPGSDDEPAAWSLLTPIAPVAAPGITFEDGESARAIHEKLLELSRVGAAWDAVVGLCAHAVREGGLHRRFGFASFRGYCEERLGLAASTVEARAALQKRLAASPALQEARRQKLPYEKLRLLCRLPESDIGAWVARAKKLTVIALRRRLEREADARMCAAGKFTTRVPVPMAQLLTAAMESVRTRAGGRLSAGRCLAELARHFTATWKGAVSRKTPSQTLRERDGGWCTVPGCSHRATDEHHVLYRSQGGGNEAENKTAVCGYHHHRCIHAGHVKAWGKAPDQLTWVMGGESIAPEGADAEG